MIYLIVQKNSYQNNLSHNISILRGYQYSNVGTIAIKHWISKLIGFNISIGMFLQSKYVVYN